MEVFKTPHVFFKIERHLRWQDVMALMQTCRVLYYEWLSKDTERWKDARLFKSLPAVLGIPKPRKLNVVCVVRKKALDGISCMGGCGGCNVQRYKACKSMPVIVCSHCALRCDMYGWKIIQLYAEKTEVISHEVKQYGLNYCRNKMGTDVYHVHRAYIVDRWEARLARMAFAAGWIISAYEKERVRAEMDAIMSTISSL